MSSKSIYDVTPDFGVLYDGVPAYATRPDVGFYTSEAERRAADGPVLDLGCGTGRLLFPLARAGHTVSGVDRSPAMLARCRERLSNESSDVRSRVALYEGDARDFTIPQPRRDAMGAAGFRFAVAPFRIIQHLLTIEDQLRCLAAVRRHLEPGGYFAFDVFNPNFALMATDRSEEFEDTPEHQLEDGRFFRRTARVLRVRSVAQVSDIELIYYIRTGERTERVVQAFEMRWYTVSELEHLLVRAGFSVEAIHGDFDRGWLRDGSPEIVIVAARQ